MEVLSRKMEGHLPIVVISVFLALPITTYAADPQLTVTRQAALPATATDGTWTLIKPVAVPLIPQDMVEPRQLTPTTPEVAVRSVTDGTRIAFLLEWADTTVDDVQKPAQCSDACAVQVPAPTAPDLPAPQMGEPGRRVEITYWRAAWQATVDGRSDSLQALYPGAAIDHYPFEAAPLDKDAVAQQEMAKRYAPARAVGNSMAGPRKSAVEDLIAEGPGSLSPAAEPASSGGGKRGPTGWTVMLVRPLSPELAAGKRSQVAFAIWDGARGEVGARKMRSAWIPIVTEVSK
jgi:DMSO reductase family type II enzyme heme b subunit